MNKRNRRRNPPSQIPRVVIKPIPQPPISLSAWLIRNIYYIGASLGVIFLLIYLRYSSAASKSQKNILPALELYEKQRFFKPNDGQWLNQIKYTHDSSFDHPLYRDENMKTIAGEISAQKRILNSLSLKAAAKAALSHTQIHFIPYRQGGVTGQVLYNEDKLLYALFSLMTNSERRQTLLNELHHLTIKYVNKQKLGNSIHVSGERLLYPFLNEQGEIDHQLKKELKSALEEIKEKVNDLNTILKKDSSDLTEDEKMRLAVYLDALKEYQPTVFRHQIPEYLFSALVKKGMVAENGQITFPDERGNTFYGYVLDHDEGKITILTSYNKDNSPKELASAFIKDYFVKQHTLEEAYPEEYKNMGKKFTEIDYIIECSSDIEELILHNPKVREVFAKKYTEYFDKYCELSQDLIATNKLKLN